MQGVWIDVVRFRCFFNIFRECLEEFIKIMIVEIVLGVGNQNEKKEVVCRGRRYENKFFQKIQFSVREISQYGNNGFSIFRESVRVFSRSYKYQIGEKL